MKISYEVQDPERGGFIFFDDKKGFLLKNGDGFLISLNTALVQRKALPFLLSRDELLILEPIINNLGVNHEFYVDDLVAEPLYLMLLCQKNGCKKKK